MARHRLAARDPQGFAAKFGIKQRAAHCDTQFPGLRLLLPHDVQRAVEIQLTSS